MEKKYELVWDKLTKEGISKVMSFSEDYKCFIDSSKTEREAAAEIVRLAEEAGFVNIEDAIYCNRRIKAGDKVYAVNKDKTVAMFVLGCRSLEWGMNIVGSHIDSPRLDLKANPLYEEQGFSMLETHYYGGIKKYQWVTIPLAIHGVIIKKNGERLNIVIGEDEKDPVLYITDLPIHLAADQMDKKLSKGIEGEELNILFGSIPVKEGSERDKVKSSILMLLNHKYGILEEDFAAAELEVVPSGRARDVGLDRSMVMAYGHDDRICAYTSLRAILEMEKPERTCAVIFVDKEEIGSTGATGMQSRFLENTVAEIMNLTDDYNELKLRRALANSEMLSADVTTAMDPTFQNVSEKNNIAYLGKGIVLVKYAGSGGKKGCNDANAEYVGSLRDIFNDNGVTWQTGEVGKVDHGGGGTIAHILAAYNMEVIDCGIPLLSMHAPWEVASKADIYEAYRAYRTFLKKA